MEQHEKTKEFIRKAIEVHGDKYDYSKVEYVNAKTKVIIICKEHGAFLQNPDCHKKSGCSKCVGRYIPSTEEIIEKSKEIHGDKYDYSKVKYINNHTKIIIICKKHGEFLQLPSHHIGRGYGCSKCSGKYSPNTAEFIEKAKEIHGDKYDYSKVDYISCKKHVIIICKTHGEFSQTPDGHISGSKCKICSFENSAIIRRKTIDEFIEESTKIHGDTYDYSNVDYISCKIPVIIICKKHGEFLQRPEVHYIGGGCNKCSGKYSPTSVEFIEKAIQIHGNKYDYSKVDYVNSKTNIIIICKKHGEFLQAPSHHVGRGDGCIKCGITYSPTTAEFISKATEIHGDTYDYTKVEYINVNTNITIICKKHGEFLQTPHTHLNKKSGCNSCAIERTADIRKKPLFEFIQQAKNTHGDKYDYSKVDYVNSNTKIIIICKKHGEFSQIPGSHIQGSGCSKCAGKYIPTTAEFIEKAKEIHGDNYDYSKVNYTKAKNKIIIICKIHGDFEQEAYSHSISIGCSKCAGKYSPNTEEYIEKAMKKHGNKYDYSKVEYISGKTKIIIICKKHGEFLQSPGRHIQGSGCPICVNKTEAKLYEKIITIYPSLIIQFKQDWCMKKSYLPYDFCIPEYKIIIELDGAQHFRQVRDWKSPEEQFENDKYKEECANQNGYSIIRLLQEDVFYDTYDWAKELCDGIEEIIKNNEVTNIYLCQNDEYYNFII